MNEELLNLLEGITPFLGLMAIIYVVWTMLDHVGLNVSEKFMDLLERSAKKQEGESSYGNTGYLGRKSCENLTGGKINSFISKIKRIERSIARYKRIPSPSTAFLKTGSIFSMLYCGVLLLLLPLLPHNIKYSFLIFYALFALIYLLMAVKASKKKFCLANVVPCYLTILGFSILFGWLLYYSCKEIPDMLVIVSSVLMLLPVLCVVLIYSVKLFPAIAIEKQIIKLSDFYEKEEDSIKETLNTCYQRWGQTLDINPDEIKGKQPRRTTTAKTKKEDPPAATESTLFPE